MLIELFIISPNSFINYLFDARKSNYNITKINRLEDIFNLNYLSSLPVIICDDHQSFLRLKNTIYKEKLIFLTNDKDIIWSYKILKPFKVEQCFALILNLFNKQTYKINNEILFCYSNARLIKNNATTINLTSFESEILHEIINNKNFCNKLSIIARIWPKNNHDYATKNLDNFIYKLRNKLASFNLEIANNINEYQLVDLN